MYVWKPKTLKPKQTIEDAIEMYVDGGMNLGSVNKLLSRPSVEVTEECGTVVITLPHITITIKQR